MAACCRTGRFRAAIIVKAGSGLGGLRAALAKSICACSARLADAIGLRARFEAERDGKSRCLGSTTIEFARLTFAR